MLSSGHATDDVVSLLNWDAPLYNEKLVNQASLGRTAKPKSKPSKEDEHVETKRSNGCPSRRRARDGPVSGSLW